MNLLPLICSILFLASFSHADNQTQVFPTSSGPVRITPLNHASTLVAAGGKFIYLDPAKPVDFSPFALRGLECDSVSQIAHEVRQSSRQAEGYFRLQYLCR